MLKRNPMLASLAIVGLTAMASQAAVLTQYTFGPDTTASSGGTLAATTTATDVSNTSVAAGPSAEIGILYRDTNAMSGASNGLTTINNAGGSAAAFPVLTARSFGSSSIAGALAGDYFGFTVQPTGGKAINLANIVLDGASGGSETRSFEVRYSFDDFATTLVAGGATLVNPGSGTMFFNRYTYTLNDQNVALQETTGTLSVRIYGSTGSTTREIRFDNITINGEVVPEPSCLAGLAVCSALLAGRRRA